MTYLTREEKEVHCPLEYGMSIFGGKWKPRIICVLASEEAMRYSDIRKELVNLTDTVLSASLKELTADGIVERRQYDSIPPRVEYSLTEKGKTVVPILQSISPGRDSTSTRMRCTSWRNASAASTSIDAVIMTRIGRCCPADKYLIDKYGLISVLNQHKFMHSCVG